MRTTLIQRTDLRVSVLCLGTADAGLKNTEPQAHAVFDAFVERGGNFFDTARIYSDWAPGELHRSERILGDWLASSGARKDVVIATKCGLRMVPGQGIRAFLRPEHIREDLNGSLASLRVDSIDLYYVHTDDAAIPVEEIIDTLDELVSAGSIRHYACSNWDVDRMTKARDYASRKGTRGFVADQMRWNAALSSAHRSPVSMNEAMYKFLLESSMAAIAWSSQANGFFTKLCQKNGIPDESIRKHPYYSESNLRRFHALRDVGASAGITVTEAVLLYLLCQELNTVPVVGTYTIEHLTDSLSVADKTLAPEAFRAIVNAVAKEEVRCED